MRRSQLKIYSAAWVCLWGRTGNCHLSPSIDRTRVCDPVSLHYRRWRNAEGGGDGGQGVACLHYVPSRLPFE
jgi:hypothetical protein